MAGESKSDHIRINQLIRVASDLQLTSERSSSKETVFFKSGTGIIGILSILQCLTLSRFCNQAFRIYRFDKIRILSTITPLPFSVFAPLYHDHFVLKCLIDDYRKEDTMHHGIKSFLWYQIGVAAMFVFSPLMVMAKAESLGLVPLGESIYTVKGIKPSFEYMTSKLRPYFKRIVVFHGVASLLAFAMGALEYRESRGLLKKLNRKTPSQIED